MEQNKDMLDRFRAMLGTVDDGLAAARSRRLGRPSASSPAPAPTPVAKEGGSDRPRFKAVRISRPIDAPPAD